MTDYELAKKLHLLALAESFSPLVLANASQLGNFIPTENDCHGNVDRWVSLHPQQKAVRGYLIINDCIFNKHSVVETGTELLDITPRLTNDAKNLLRFIEFRNIDRGAFDLWPNQVIYSG